MRSLFHSRKFRQGSVATAVTAIVIALIIILNAIVSEVSGRYGLSLDLTENKIFAISSDTMQYLESLNKDVEIYILSTEQNFIANGNYFVQASEVIKKYRQVSPRISVEYIDLARNPTFPVRFPELNLNASSIVVASGTKSTDLTPYDLYNIETDQYYNSRITSSKAEQAMTSAILRVTSDKLTRVAMLAGHNGAELAGFRSLMELNNYEIVEQNFVTEEIDPDAVFAVIAAPMRDFSDDELKRLDKFLNNDGKLGKTLLYFAAVDQPALPNLDAFLAEWGIEAGGGAVFETSNKRMYNLNNFLPMVDYTEDVFSKTVKDAGLDVLIPYAKPLTALYETKSRFTVSSPLMFAQSSVVIPEDATESWTPEAAERQGPFPALILSQMVDYAGTERLVSSVAVCSSVLAVEDSYLSATSIGNGQYFLNLINTLSNREDIINIQSKTIGGGELGIQDSSQILSIGIMFMAILPLAVLICGVVVWLRRRHR